MDLSLSSHLILLLPLAMFLILGLTGMKMSHRLAGVLGTLGMGVTLLLAYAVAATYFFSGSSDFVDAAGLRLQYSVFDYTWLEFTDSLVIKLGFFLDPISAMMLVVITTVSFMVHLYSLGYMKGEVGFQRYYAFLSLFSFSMLGLVVATNIFQMYIFWELVGVSAHRVLLYEALGCVGVEEGVYRHPLCRLGLSRRNPYPVVLYSHVRLPHAHQFARSCHGFDRRRHFHGRIGVDLGSGVDFHGSQHSDDEGGSYDITSSESALGP